MRPTLGARLPITGWNNIERNLILELRLTFLLT